MDETEEQHVEVNEVQEKIPIEEPVVKEKESVPVKPIEQVQSITPIQSIIPNEMSNVNNNNQIRPIVINTTTSDNSNTLDNLEKSTKLSFSDIDRAIDSRGNETNIEAPKTIERLENISSMSFEKQRHLDHDEDEDKLRIGDDIRLDMLDINDLNHSINVRPPPMLDVEILG
jgi:hypothetical protein